MPRWTDGPEKTETRQILPFAFIAMVVQKFDKTIEFMSSRIEWN